MAPSPVIGGKTIDDRKFCSVCTPPTRPNRQLTRVLSLESWSPPVTPSVVAALLATAFLILHLAFLPTTPTGVDAANFVLGVREFNVADHRPHPPGYPVFIAFGKASRAVLEHLPITEFRRRETYGLAIWSAVFGTIGIFTLRQLFRAIDPDDRRAVAAAALTVTCPLFWFNAMRPMSDVSGLAAASAAQALTATAFRRGREGATGARALLIGGAVVAGVAIGFRSQVTWLTLPLLSFAAFDEARRAGARTILWVVAAVTIGALVWGLPLVMASGGPSAYITALTAQAGEDLVGVQMLATTPDFTRATQALVRMIAYPWVNRYIAIVILSLATLGALYLVMRARATGALLALCFAPYVMFHLLFQDTTLLRYALPVVPVLAYLAVRGLDWAGRRWMVSVVAALAIACVVVATPAVVSYARTGSPSLRALDAIRDRLPLAERRPVLAMHHAAARVLRLEDLPVPTLRAPAKHEWLELVKYWISGGDAPIWFLAEPERTDLALVDPSSRHLVRSYRLPLNRRFFMTGVRPSGIDWYEIDAPSWFAAEGWALTHETAGIASEDRRGPDYAPINAFVTRRADAAVVMVGGRHLDPGGKSVRLDLSIDGHPMDSWVVSPTPAFFLRMIPLPPGTLLTGRQLRPDATHSRGGASQPTDSLPAGRYARLQIRSVAIDGTQARVPTAVNQFDVQSADRIVFGFGDGWYEQEYDPVANSLWRWTGQHATLRIHHGGHRLELRIAGRAPAEWLGGPTNITVRTGDRVVRRVTVSQDFELRAQVLTEALDQSGGLLTIESDRTFVPDAVIGNGDRRTLALRVDDLRIEPVR
jgi:hypothetical protein